MDLLRFYEYQILSILGLEAILDYHIKNFKGELIVGLQCLKLTS